MTSESSSTAVRKKLILRKVFFGAVEGKRKDCRCEIYSAFDSLSHVLCAKKLCNRFFALS
jgi:hypothetical protein